jgi:hypothetical protein
LVSEQLLYSMDFGCRNLQGSSLHRRVKDGTVVHLRVYPTRTICENGRSCLALANPVQVIHRRSARTLPYTNIIWFTLGVILK